MHFASYYRWLIIRDWLRVQPSARVLDVGCDDGHITAQVRASQRVAFDLNPRCPDPAVRLVRGNACHLPLAAAQFDTVLAFDLIEHVDDDRAVLSELMRVLRPDGTLWISTPAAKFAIFPAWLTPRANRGFGHVRNGYTLADLQEKLPAGVHIDLTAWNEPTFRFMFAGLRLLDDVSPAFARRLAGLLFHLDRRRTQGLRGHLLVRVSRLPAGSHAEHDARVHA